MARGSFANRQYPPANPSFPTVDSLMNRDTMPDAPDYMGTLATDRRHYAGGIAMTDPEGAGIATADIDGMNEGFRSLVTSGWDPAEAAHAIGAVGKTFGSYGNVEVDLALRGHQQLLLRRRLRDALHRGPVRLAVLPLDVP